MAQMTQRGQLVRDDSNFPAGWKPFYLSATGVTVVKDSPGILHSIILNKPVATTTIALCDNASTATGTFGVITIPASPQPVTLTYDTIFDKGLVVDIGTAASDITVSYV